VSIDSSSLQTILKIVSQPGESLPGWLFLLSQTEPERLGLRLVALFHEFVTVKDHASLEERIPIQC
jgi:hypothetical protein